MFFVFACIASLTMAVSIRIDISGYFRPYEIVSHSILGFIVLPVLIIPVHELLHIIPYYIAGAKKIRVGMDLKQYLFYVTAHRHVAGPSQFRIVAVLPFIIISLISLFLIFYFKSL